MAVHDYCAPAIARVVVGLQRGYRLNLQGASFFVGVARSDNPPNIPCNLTRCSSQQLSGQKAVILQTKKDDPFFLWVLTSCCFLPCITPKLSAHACKDPKLPTNVFLLGRCPPLPPYPLPLSPRTQIAELRRGEDAYMDPANRRRRTRARSRSDGASASDDDGSGGDDDGDGREKTYSDDYNDRACAALLKYKRVAGFVLGAGGWGREAGRARKKRSGGVAADGDFGDVGDVGDVDASGPSPEDIVEWLDARLLDKNIPPLYRTGLKPEHAPLVVETLLRSGGSGRGVAEAERVSVAFGGLGEAVVREIVVGEASRRAGGEGEAGGEDEGESADRGVEDAPSEVAEAVAAMFGEGQSRDEGQDQGQVQDQDQPQRGPWLHK